MGRIAINIDGYELFGNEGDSILNVACAAGIKIPTLCHDDRLESYGACGICVVEAQNSPRLLRACSTAIAPGMIINTKSERVLASRKSTLELLLSDHTGDCRSPCLRACPADTDCQGYVGLIANGEFRAAYDVIKENIPLPASIGRVCPHPCEAECRRKHVEEPVAIRDLKRFAADYVMNRKENDDLSRSIRDEAESLGFGGKRVSIIGGGPGGLTAAYFLRKKGHIVSLYDAQPKMGGMLRYGIPEYRLPKAVLDAEIEDIRYLGVRMYNDVKIGDDLTFEHIRNISDAVIVAVGCQKSVTLGCPGEDLPGVVGGTDFLREIASGDSSNLIKKVAVVGGGNTAMDACRTAVRLGAETVWNVYRRTRDEMPAESIEIAEAEEEGVIFKHLCNPIEIISHDNKAAGIRLQKMELGEPGADGRRAPVPIPGAEEIIDADLIIIAIGQSVDIHGFEGLELTQRKTISADRNTFRTNLEGVFALGDATNKGAGIAIEAIGDAKHASEVVDSYLNGKIVAYKAPFIVTGEPDKKQYEAVRCEKREVVQNTTVMQRKSSFYEYNQGFTKEQAVKEATRCLECGCMEYYNCKLLKYSRELEADREKYAGKTHNRDKDDSSPFLVIDHDKCILCGQCVRICSEVMGHTALGLTERGFDTNISPAMKLPLTQTDCISCGQCAAICPTGAFDIKYSIKKPVPLKEKRTDTTCSFCSLGCKVTAATYSKLVMRCLPTHTDSSAIGSLLCARGRYALSSLNNYTRITTPFMKKSGKQFVASYPAAYMEVTKNLQRIAGLYGKDAIAVAVSDKYCNEDIYLIKQYAEKTLRTDNIYSVNSNESGLTSVLGCGSSTNTLDEAYSADVIMLVAPDLVNSHTIADVKIKKAAENGAKVILISDNKANTDDWAHIKIALPNDSPTDSEDPAAYDTRAKKILAQFAKLLYAEKKSKKTGSEAYETDEFAAYLETVEDNPGLKDAVELYSGAKHAMIVYDATSLSAYAETLIADIAVFSGHIGKPRSGIVALKANNNSQGLADMGVRLGGNKLAAEISDGRIKALLVFGENLPWFELEKLEFLLVCDSIATETSNKADIVLPLTQPPETDGTYTNTERRIQSVNPSFTSVFGKTNLEIICELANNSQKRLNYTSYEEVITDIKRNVRGYENARPGAYTYDKPVLCDERNFKLCAPNPQLGFTVCENTNYVFKKFDEYLSLNSLMK